MNTHEKVLFIIKELELSARQVANAIGKSTSVVSDKKKQIKSNRFLERDLKKLKEFYVEKLTKIKKL